MEQEQQNQANIISQSLDNIEIWTNAKGEFQWKVKLYRQEAFPIELFLKDVKDINEKIEKKYGGKNAEIQRLRK